MENSSQDSKEAWHQLLLSNGTDGSNTSSGSFKMLSGSLLVLLVLSTLAGNSLVCLAVVRFRHLRAKVTNWFVLSLAVSDLCVALLVMPWKAVTEVAGGAWLFGGRFCDAWVAFDIMCCTASIFHLCIISLDRYWAIASPFRYERRMTPGLASAMIALAWTLSILISFIPVQLHWHKAEEAGSFGRLPSPQRCDARLNRTYAVASSLISFYIPVTIMIGTYTQIYRIAQAQIRRISSLERAGGLGPTQGKEPASSLRSSLCKETKVLQTLSIIVGVFVCCWLPFFLLNCLLPFCESRPDSSSPLRRDPCVSQTVFNVFMWLGWANSSVNPVIYAFNADFRRAFASLLGCRGRNLPCRTVNSSTVERVNLSNELASYHHNSSCHKRGSTSAPFIPPAIGAWSHSLPHAVDFQGEDESCGRPLLEKERPPSCPATHTSDYRNLDRPALLPFECEPEISLDTLTPFTEMAGH